MSSDGGANFSSHAQMYPSAIVHFDPANEAAFHLMDPGQISTSTDAAATWTHFPAPSVSNSYFAVTFAPSPTLWVAPSYGIVSSTDQGTHWNLSLALNEPFLSQDPNSQDVLYAGSSDNAGPVFRYENGSWQQLPGVLPTPGHRIAQSPAGPGHLLAAGGVEINSSEDGGASWNRTDKGVSAWYPLALAGSKTRMYVGGGGRNFAWTENAGAWNIGEVPATNALFAATVSMAADPSDANYVLAGTSEGLHRSTDGGAHWSALGAALAGDSTGVRVEGIAFHADDPTIVYATYGKGTTTRIIRSTDHGATFQLVGDDLPALQRVFSFVVDKHKSGHVLLTGTDFQQLYGLFRSTDGGVHWTQVINRKDVVNVAFDASNGNRLYAPTGGAEGLLISDDGGATWKGAPEFDLYSLGFTWDVATDPTQPDVVYAISVKYGPPVTFWWLLRSVDAGQTWEKVEAPSVRNWQPMKIAIAPDSPSIVYLSAEHRSMYSVEFVPDLNVAVQGHSGQKTANAANQFSVRVHNSGPFAATGVALSINLPSSAQNISATVPNGMCTKSGGDVQCSIKYLKNGQDAVASVTYTPTAAGAIDVNANVSARERDGVPNNNTAAATATATASSLGGNSGANGSSGGGGALTIPLLLLLTALRVLRTVALTAARRLCGSALLDRAASLSTRRAHPAQVRSTSASTQRPRVHARTSGSRRTRLKLVACRMQSRTQ